MRRRRLTAGSRLTTGLSTTIKYVGRTVHSERRREQRRKRHDQVYATHKEQRRGQRPGHNNQVPVWRRGLRPGLHDLVLCLVFARAQTNPLRF